MQRRAEPVPAGGEGDDAPTVKKTKLLLGLKDEVIKLKLSLSEEQTEREKVSEWIKATLRPSLQRMNTNVSSKFEELEAALAQETATRTKINEWLKVKVGPELEEVEALVVKKLLVEREQWEREKRDQQKEELAQLERTWVKKFDDERDKLRETIAASVSAATASVAVSASGAGKGPQGLSREEVEDIVRRKVADVRYEGLQETLKREEEVKRAVEERWRKDLLLKDDEWRRRQDEWERRVEEERRRWQDMTHALLQQQVQASASSAAAAAAAAVPVAAVSAKPSSGKGEVAEWLRSCACERYAENFVAHGYDSLLVVQQMDSADLDTIGVTLPGHRKVLLAAVAKLSGHPAPAVVPASNGTASAGSTPVKSPQRPRKAEEKGDIFAADEKSPAPSPARKSADVPPTSSPQPAAATPAPASAAPKEESSSSFSIFSPLKSLLGMNEEEERAKELERKRREEAAARARGRGRGGRGRPATTTPAASGRSATTDPLSGGEAEANRVKAEAEAEAARKREAEAKEREERERWIAEDKARDEREKREREEREKAEREERQKREEHECEERERREREERERREREGREREERERREREEKEEREKREREHRERFERERKEQREREQREREEREKEERERRERRDREERLKREEEDRKEREAREEREREEREYQLLKARFEEEEERAKEEEARRLKGAQKEQDEEAPENPKPHSTNAGGASPAAGRGRGRGGRGPLPQARGRGREETTGQQRKEREDRERKEREAESERRKREEEAAKQKAAASQAQQETAAKKKDSVGKLNSHRFAFLDADSPDALFGDIDSAAPSAAPVRSASPEAKRDVSPRDVQPADSGNAEPLAAKSRRGPRPVSSGGATPVSVNKDETPAAKPERSKLSQERFAFLGGEVDTKEAADVDSPVVEPAKGILKERPRSQPAGKRVSFYQNSAGEEEDVDDERDAAEEQEARRNLEKQKREEEERRERETVEKQEKERRDKERRDKLREERVAKAGGAEEKKGGSLRINNEKCHVCAKTVYFNERLSAEGVIFHNACFRCNHCNGKLKLGSYASLEGKYFCKPHFKQLFKAKGNYSEGFGKEKPTAKWLSRSTSERFDRSAFADDDDEQDNQQPEDKPTPQPKKSAQAPAQTAEPAHSTTAKPQQQPAGGGKAPVKKSVLARYAHVTGAAEGEDNATNGDEAKKTSPRGGASAGGGGPSDYSVDEEVSKLCDIAERLVGGPRGLFKFKDIFYDEEAESAFESLVGTLLAARKRKILVFDSPMLLQGVHDDLDIVFTGRP